VNLSKERSLVQPRYNFLTVMHMKVNGKTIKQMDSVSTNTIQEPFIKVTGAKICRMVLEFKHGLITAGMKALTRMVKSMGKENMFGLMEAITKVHGKAI
jgi:hypothetical protein